MKTTSCIVLNGLMSVTAILANIFFFFCLLYAGNQKETIKQPVKVLLISLVTSNLCLPLAILLYIFVDFVLPFSQESFVVIYIAENISYTSLSCSVWLSVFYCSRIVPAQQAFFIWIKKNIKTIIYCGLTLEHFAILAEFFLGLPWMSNESYDICTENQNVTSKVDTKSAICTFIQVLNFSYVFFFTVVMALSWGSTLVYLCRHMKRMEMISSPFSSSRLRSQFGVTIMSVVQTGLSVSFVFFNYLYWYYLYQYDQNSYAIETTYSLFSFGTTLNIALGQSLIRKRIANCFNKVSPVLGKLRPFHW